MILLAALSGAQEGRNWLVLATCAFMASCRTSWKGSGLHLWGLVRCCFGAGLWAVSGDCEGVPALLLGAWDCSGVWSGAWLRSFGPQRLFWGQPVLVVGFFVQWMAKVRSGNFRSFTGDFRSFTGDFRSFVLSGFPMTVAGLRQYIRRVMCFAEATWGRFSGI